MTWKSALATAAFAGAAIVAAATPLLAQAVQTSTLTGTVKDESGGVLPSVTVTVISPAQIGGAQVSVTDGQGIYRFPALHPGIYQMETQLSGFKTVRRGDVALALGTTTTIDVSLPVA